MSGDQKDSHTTRRDVLAFGVLSVLSSLPAYAQAPESNPRDVGAAQPKNMKVFKDESAKARYMAAYDAVLQEWPVPYEAIHCPTRYGVTHVVASGPSTAQPVILLPALLTTATSWRPNIAALSQHFRCYAVDVIGEVNKSEPTRALKNREDCVEWLADVLDALRLEKASLVGASLGGFFALNLGVHKPNRVDRIVLIGPANVLPMATWKFMYYVGLAAIGFDGPFDRWMGAGIPWNPADNSSGALWAANSEGRGLINDINLGSVGEEEWRTVRASTLLLIGDRDVTYRDPPEKTLKRALQRIPGLKGEIVPNANHLAARANREFVNERVVRFLREGV